MEVHPGPRDPGGELTDHQGRLHRGGVPEEEGMWSKARGRKTGCLGSGGQQEAGRNGDHWVDGEASGRVMLGSLVSLSLTLSLSNSHASKIPCRHWVRGPSQTSL